MFLFDPGPVLLRGLGVECARRSTITALRRVAAASVTGRGPVLLGGGLGKFREPSISDVPPAVGVPVPR